MLAVLIGWGGRSIHQPPLQDQAQDLQEHGVPNSTLLHRDTVPKKLTARAARVSRYSIVFLLLHYPAALSGVTPEFTPVQGRHQETLEPPVGQGENYQRLEESY